MIPSPFMVYADQSNTPILVCDEEYKIVYKNTSAKYLEFKRIGSFVTNHLSKQDRLRLHEHNFDKNPCFCSTLDNQSSQYSVVFVCKYPINPCNTLWIIPKMPSIALQHWGNKLKSFIPIFAHCINAEEPGNTHRLSEKDNVIQIIKRKSLAIALENFISSKNQNPQDYSTTALMIQRFLTTHLPSVGYKPEVTYYSANNFFLIQNANVFACLYLNTLFTLLECTALNTVKVTIKTENSSSAIETKLCLANAPKAATSLIDLASNYQEHTIDLMLCHEILSLYNIDTEIYPIDGDEYNYTVIMKSDLLMPGLLCSPVLDCSLDDLYNKFLLFLGNI